MFAAALPLLASASFMLASVRFSARSISADGLSWLQAANDNDKRARGLNAFLCFIIFLLSELLGIIVRKSFSFQNAFVHLLLKRSNLCEGAKAVRYIKLPVLSFSPLYPRH